MKFQNSSWTRTGVPRKNHTYTQLAPLVSGLGDSRMTASTTPRTIPMTIATTVSSSVASRPRRIRLVKKKWPTTSHPKRGLVATELISVAARTTMIAEAIQRPGWRTGTALTSSSTRG